MPSLSVRFESSVPGEPITLLDVLTCEAVTEAARELGLPEPLDFLGVTKEEWDINEFEANGAGPWQARDCPWFEIGEGRRWCEAIEGYLRRPERAAEEWPGMVEDIVRELDEMRSAFEFPGSQGLRWNLLHVE